jgi:hypothetical protein
VLVIPKCGGTDLRVLHLNLKLICNFADAVHAGELSQYCPQVLNLLPFCGDDCVPHYLHQLIPTSAADLYITFRLKTFG